MAGNPHVIAGTNAGAPLIKLQKPWRRIRATANLHDVRIHDLRHSFASIAAGAGMSLPLIGRLLDHSLPATTARYAHLAADPVRAASNLVGNEISAAMTPILENHAQRRAALTLISAQSSARKNAANYCGITAIKQPAERQPR